MSGAIIICGSAEEGGVTYAMCSSAKAVLEKKGYQVSLFNPSDMDLHHCRDCKGCAQGECIIEDEMSSIYRSFSESDLIVLASPIHFSGPSSILKMVMDRFQPYWCNKDLTHPDYCISMLCGGSKQPNFQITETIIRAFCLTTGMEYRGSLQIPDTDSGVSDLEDRVEKFLSVW